MAQSINLADLLEGVVPYEPALLRVPLNTTDLMPEDELLKATAKTAQDVLKRSGVSDVEITQDDVESAQEMFMEHIKKTPQTKQKIKNHKPETIVKLEALVSEYDWRVIQHADQIRFLVTNKLIGLSDHRDPRVQLKAVELLGKLADVGMFVDKQEITYKQQTAEELQAQLQAKLGILIQGEIIDAEIQMEKPKRRVGRVDEDGVTPLPDLPEVDLDKMLRG